VGGERRPELRRRRGEVGGCASFGPKQNLDEVLSSWPNSIISMAFFSYEFWNFR
jgi:hypothetical protein